MPNYESITICGHLGKDADMRETSAGHVTEFSVAVNHGKGDKKTATWYPVNCWHGVAKGCQHLHKGDAVICIGNMRCGKWTDDEGVTRYPWTFQAHTVGKALYVKDEPSSTHQADYHQPVDGGDVDTEPIDGRADDSYDEPSF